MATNEPQFTPEQVQRIGKAVVRVEKLPRGKWEGPSKYAPGVTTALIGKLTSDLVYVSSGDQSSFKATFKQWGASDPNDEDSAEEELEYDELTVWAWTMDDHTKLVSGTRVKVEFIAGRWYVTNAQGCPDNVTS